MKVETRIFVGMTIFFVLVAPIYAFVTLWLDGHVEPIGTTVLTLTLLFCLMVAGLFKLTGRTIDPRPEDRKSGEIIEGAGALGFFPPSSIVPFWSTAVLAVIALGAVFGWWLTLLGIGLGIWAVCGWAYEFYLGDYKH